MKSGFINCAVLRSGVNSDEYHAKTVERGDPAYPMSPSQIKAFMECPKRWLAGYEPPATTAKAWGNLLDCRILTPDQFEKRYAVRPATYPAPPGHAKVKKGLIDVGEPLPWNANAGYCSDWKDAQEGKEIVKAEEHADLQTAEQRLLDDALIASLLESCDRQVLVTGIWQDAETEIEIPVQCLIDLVPRADTEWSKCLADLKSTRCAAPRPFQNFAFQQAYHVQASFDLDLYSSATGEDRNTWLFILQENYAPWQPGRRMLGQRFLEIGRRQYQHALAKYAQCLATHLWPDYDDSPEAIQGWTLMQPEVWMEMQDWKFAVANQNADEEETEPEASETPT